MRFQIKPLGDNFYLISSVDYSHQDDLHTGFAMDLKKYSHLTSPEGLPIVTFGVLEPLSLRSRSFMGSLSLAKRIIARSNRMGECVFASFCHPSFMGSDPSEYDKILSTCPDPQLRCILVYGEGGYFINYSSDDGQWINLSNVSTINDDDF